MIKVTKINKDGNVIRHVKRPKRKKRTWTPDDKQRQMDKQFRDCQDGLSRKSKFGRSLGTNNSLKGMKPVMRNSVAKTHNLGRCNMAYYAQDRRPTITENPQLSNCK